MTSRRPPHALLLAAALAVALLAPACARKAPPTGGPPDLTPPHVTGTMPESLKAGVARDTRLEITFSEGMEPRSTGDAVSLAPPDEIRQRRWSGRTLTLVLADSLRADRTYTLIVAPTARDRHGNTLAGGATVVFSTAAHMPPGVIEGRLESVGFAVEGTYLWCYDEGHGHRPDSTARDFDAVGLADAAGGFRVAGLPVPGRYRVYVFADINTNRSFEPASDLLVPVDTTLTLTAEEPRVSGFNLRVLNPRAIGHIRGTVLDSLGIAQGDLVVTATSTTDTTKVTRVVAGTRGVFEFELTPDSYRVLAFRDLDRNRDWDPEREPACSPIDVSLPPAADVKELVLVLHRPGGGR